MKVVWERYKYWIIGGSAMLWMTIFDSNNFIELWRLQSEITELQEKKTYFMSEIERVKKEEKELFTDQRNLEKFAREKYYMKRDNEDIFIIR